MDEQNCVSLPPIQEESDQYSRLLQRKLTNLSVFEPKKCNIERCLLLKTEKLQPKRLAAAFDSQSSLGTISVTFHIEL